jgi:MoaA/NifB/PqqE/SkfB family radical SAM enzyme
VLGSKKYDILNAVKRLPSIPRDFIATTLVSKFKPILPTSMVHNVTWRCNSRCQMCENWKRESEGDLTVAEMAEIFKSRLFRRVTNVGLTGGEPYLRSDLPDIVRAYGDSMPRLHKLTISTNGFLTDRTLELTGEVLRYAGERRLLIGIRVSIDGFEETHEKVRGVPGCYRKAMETLDRLRELQKSHAFFNSGISFTLQPDSMAEMGALYDMCKREGINIVFNVPRFTAPMMANIHLEESKGIKGDNAQRMAAFFRRLTREGSIFNGDLYLYHHYAKMVRNGGYRTMACPMKTQGLLMNPDGDLFYCELGGKIGNAREGDPLNIYMDKANLHSRRKMLKAECLRCLNPCMASVGAAQQVLPYARLFFGILWERTFGRLRRGPEEQADARARKP